jgi:hypothetical protein
MGYSIQLPGISESLKQEARAYLEGKDSETPQRKRPFSPALIASLWMHCTLTSDDAWEMLSPIHEVLSSAYSRPYQNESLLRRSCTLFVALVDAAAALLGTSAKPTAVDGDVATTEMSAARTLLTPHLSAFARLVSGELGVQSKYVDTTQRKRKRETTKQPNKNKTSCCVSPLVSVINHIGSFHFISCCMYCCFGEDRR